MKNKNGMPVRSAQSLANSMDRFSSDIKIKTEGKETNGKSFIGIMAADIKYGRGFEVSCKGADEEAMLSEACNIIESSFN